MNENREGLDSVDLLNEILDTLKRMDDRLKRIEENADPIKKIAKSMNESIERTGISPLRI